MNEVLRKELLACESDVDGALKRFFGNEELYVSFLEAFIKEKTMDELTTAIEEKNWDTAFLSAHELKGLAGNLGFVPLFHSLGELILLLRANKINEISETYLVVKNSYWRVVTAVMSGLQ